jgi:hypothetical protein
VPQVFFGVAALLGAVTLLPAQNSPARQTLLMPEANRPPDANEKMAMDQARHRVGNFDAANTLRARHINDDSTKLLILANDLKRQMDQLGDRPVPDRLRREAEVIESLARDVQKEMTLTIKGS